MSFAESSCVCIPSFRSVASFYSSGKSTNFFWFVFFLIKKGVWPYKHAYDVHQVTLILNIYIYIYIY